MRNLLCSLPPLLNRCSDEAEETYTDNDHLAKIARRGHCTWLRYQNFTNHHQSQWVEPNYFQKFLCTGPTQAPKQDATRCELC